MATLKSHSSSSIIFLAFFIFSLILIPKSLSFQSDELDDEEFEGFTRSTPDLTTTTTTTRTTRRKSTEPESDSKVQFTLEHSFGDEGFSPSGVFTARLRSSVHGGQTLTKLRFSRNAFTETEKENFKKLLEDDDFYQIRLPSNVNSPGKDYVISSVKARCLPRDALDEHFVIHTDGVRILGVNYGSPGSCPHPRQLNFPTKWSFNSHAFLKSSEQAPRTPVFAEDSGIENVEGEAVKPPEKSFWAKYWMYMIPLGLIVMNAVTQAMNMPEEQAGGQGASQPGAAAIGRGPSTVARRR